MYVCLNMSVYSIQSKKKNYKKKDIITF
jgi:hypothetical protein